MPLFDVTLPLLAAVIVVRFVCVMAYGYAIRRFGRYFEKRTVHGAVAEARGRHSRLVVRQARARHAASWLAE